MIENATKGRIMTKERIAELRKLAEEYGKTWFFYQTLIEVLDALEASQAELADIRIASDWIVNCAEYDEGSILANEKALAQAKIEHARCSRRVGPPYMGSVEDWAMLVARQQGRDEARAELALSTRDAAILAEAEANPPPLSARFLADVKELAALRNLFAACGENIHACSGGQPVTLAAINDAWAGVCAAQVTRRDAPSAPGEGEVAVSQAYLDALENAANQFCGSCRDKPTCTMSAKVTGTGCGAWRLDATRINALRARAAGGT
jgi:hypothetical protein